MQYWGYAILGGDDGFCKDCGGHWRGFRGAGGGKIGEILEIKGGHLRRLWGGWVSLRGIQAAEGGGGTPNRAAGSLTGAAAAPAGPSVKTRGSCGLFPPTFPPPPGPAPGLSARPGTGAKGVDSQGRAPRPALGASAERPLPGFFRPLCGCASADLAPWPGTTLRRTRKLWPCACAFFALCRAIPGAGILSPCTCRARESWARMQSGVASGGGSWAFGCPSSPTSIVLYSGGRGKKVALEDKGLVSMATAVMLWVPASWVPASSSLIGDDRVCPLRWGHTLGAFLHLWREP